MLRADDKIIVMSAGDGGKFLCTVAKSAQLDALFYGDGAAFRHEVLVNGVISRKIQADFLPPSGRINIHMLREADLFEPLLRRAGDDFPGGRMGVKGNIRMNVVIKHEKLLYAIFLYYTMGHGF